MITVFYDGKCGLCAKEIQHYQKMAPKDTFDWQDITQSAEGLEKAGISLSEGLMFLHAKDENGHMHVGLEAFILIWKHLKELRLLASFVELPLVKQGADKCYKAFARWRFKRLKHCQVAAKKI